MEEYSSGLRFGKILLILLFIFILIIGTMFYFSILSIDLVLSWIGFQRNPTSIAQNSFKPNAISTTVPTESCKPQSIPTSGENSPISISRIGYSLESDCCIQQISGWECGKLEPSIFFSCSTADINGQLKFILQDGNFLDLNLGMSLIKSLRKNAYSC